MTGIVAETRRAAKVGEYLWHYDNYRNAYDENGKYLGRGAYRLVKVIGETRQSFVVEAFGKYSRLTGEERDTQGYSVRRWVFGQKEYEARRWNAIHHRRIVKLVESIEDSEVLKKIAAVIGYDHAKLETFGEDEINKWLTSYGKS